MASRDNLFLVKSYQPLSHLSYKAKINLMKNLFRCEKSRIRETKHLSTDADSSTDAIGGWTKNTPKPDFLDKRKNHQKRQNSETCRNMTKLVIRPLTRGL